MTRALGVATMGLVLAGCLSFRAVSATGKLGVRVGQERAAFDDLYGVCLEAVAVGELNSEDCGHIPPARRNLVLGLGAIAAYGSALRTLAETEDPDVEDNVTAAIEAMPFDELNDRADVIGQAVARLTALLTQVYREGQLREVIRDAQPEVARLAIALEGVLMSWADVLTAARDVSLRELDTMSIEGQRGERIVLARTAADATRELGRLETTVRALRAFAAAHAELARHGDLGADETLVAVVRTAFEVGGAAVNLASGDASAEEDTEAALPSEEATP